MTTLIITQSEIAALLPVAECIGVMRQALTALAEGNALLPLRQILRLPDGKNFFGVMPSYLGSPRGIGAKVIAAFPDNHPYDSHQGAVLLFDADHGFLVAVLDATEITAIRTAAVSGLATDLLAKADAHDLALLGTGTQAHTHLDAMLAVRKLRRVRAWSPHRESLQAFTTHAAKPTGVAIEAADSARAAVEGADLICTVTSSRDPVLHGDWIAPGAHVNAVGACFPAARELDSAAVARALLFVDRKESVLVESGDFLIPRSEGRFGDEHIRGEIGDLLLGRVPGRQSASDITLFKSLGIAVEDLAAAHYIHAKARERGIGTAVELGGIRR